ncbi:MAG: glycogen debranching protein, partial [Spirochaetaceae bacterium]|nr:glycogen debranching protein [Spirochaetaceae bacterium]
KLPASGQSGKDGPVVSRNIGYEASIALGDLKTAREIAFTFALGKKPADGSKAEKHHADLIHRNAAGWDDFLEAIPEFRSPDHALERMYYTSWFVLKSNRVCFDDPRFPYSFTSVNKYHYYNQFFWDSAYQAIAWLWYNKPEPAQDEMRNFVTNQWRNGMLPYELFLYPVNSREWMDGDGNSAGMTQPPVIGIALAEIYKKYGNREYLEFFYDSLLQYEEWLSLYRDFGKRGLSCYLNIWETGWDNSPRLDASARNRVLDPAIESADFNAYIYYMRRTIVQTAAILGREVPSRIAERMAATKQSMNALMYDPLDGFYHDLIAGTDKRIPVKTAAGLIPLITDIPDGDKRERIVRDYVESDKEFMSGCPVPSVSRSEKSYNPIDFWRGANWPQITWTVIFGLADSEPGAAGEILRKFLATTKDNVTCYEYYNAETGEGVGMPSQGWGALYTDMIMRFVAGINPEDAGMRFNPLPAGVSDFSVKNVHLKDLRLNIRQKDGSWTFDFPGYGGFILQGAHPFRAVPDADRSALEVDFEPGCGRESVRIQSAGSCIRFHFKK